MIPGVNIPFAFLANKVGAGVDELKLISIFLFSFPLCGLLKRIPDRNPWQKNVFVISISLFYLLGIFDLWNGLGHVLISSATAYGLAATIQDATMPWIAFLVLMGHMSVSHLYRQSRNDSSVVDITGAQMVLVMKLTAFCWNVHDGRLKEDILTEFQKERAIKKMPNLLEYTGYVLFFPSLMAGPAFDYVEYAKYISTSMFDLPPGFDPAKAPPTRKKRRIPRSGTPAMIKMTSGLLWLVAFLGLSGKFSTDYLVTDRFLSHNIFARVILMWAFGFAQRTKYYAVWSLAEGACILSGIGYAGVDPKTGKASWDRLVNIKPLELELAQNTRAYLGAWNINTNNWLRNYVYLRVTPKGRKPGFTSTLATFLTSAFWHGFYPGYYLTFVMGAVLQNIAQNSRRYIRPFFLSPSGEALPRKHLYDILSWIITQTFFSFTVVPFITLEIGPSIKAWSTVYFYAIAGAAAGMIFFASPAKGFLSSRVKARMERPGISRNRSQSDLVMLGVPMDAEKEFAQLDDFVRKVKTEIDRRKKAGLELDVQDIIQQKLAEDGHQDGHTGPSMANEIKKEL